MKHALELFKGTGSFSKVAIPLQYNVMSIDINKKSKPDILTDILDWDYKVEDYKNYDKKDFARITTKLTLNQRYAIPQELIFCILTSI